MTNTGDKRGFIRIFRRFFLVLHSYALTHFYLTDTHTDHAHGGTVHTTEHPSCSKPHRWCKKRCQMKIHILIFDTDSLAACYVVLQNFSALGKEPQNHFFQNYCSQTAKNVRWERPSGSAHQADEGVIWSYSKDVADTIHRLLLHRSCLLKLSSRNGSNISVLALKFMQIKRR